LKKAAKTFAIPTIARRILHHWCAAPVAKVFAAFFKKKRCLIQHDIDQLVIEHTPDRGVTGIERRALKNVVKMETIVVETDWQSLADAGPNNCGSVSPCLAV
jgi:hypothetical protein